jgi:hypothetical protein
MRDTGRGSSLITLLLALAIVAMAGTLAYHYLGRSVQQIETLQRDRPLAGAKLTADQATAGVIHRQLETYHAAHGQWPADKAAAIAVLGAPPRFQCPGNDFEYDPATGQVRLLIDDPARC